ncbi:MAG: hypothetical protein FJX71_03455 [Alphaproteobacteria bacterium]|nr:hypothetical protein [Alphaproteobacteria bacterium]
MNYFAFTPLWVGKCHEGTSIPSKEVPNVLTSKDNISLDEFVIKLQKYFNKENLTTFSEMIFSESPRGEAYQKNPLPKTEIIFNFKGYDDGFPPDSLKIRDVEMKAGEPLQLRSGVPIGYIIRLPIGQEIKAVLVKVYGGDQKSATWQERKEKMHKGALNDLERSLIQQGIGIVQLNLTDLLKLEKNQRIMPEDLHYELHASINKFFETLRDDPSSLHGDLKILQGKKIFLFGESFGGRTAIRHAELYPGTFAGYISHDGSLSAEMWLKSTSPKRRNAINLKTIDIERASQWLSPMTRDPKSDEKIKRIQDPVLLLHNLDDNRVNVKVTLYWYDKALLLGKGSLVRLYITDLGDPIPKSSAVRESDLSLKGHGSSREKEAFEKYAKVVSSFILKGHSQLPAVSEWHSQKANVRAMEYFQQASVEDKFLSMAYLVYKNSFSKASEAAQEASRKSASKSRADQDAQEVGESLKQPRPWESNLKVTRTRHGRNFMCLLSMLLPMCMILRFRKVRERRMIK